MHARSLTPLSRMKVTSFFFLAVALEKKERELFSCPFMVVQLARDRRRRRHLAWPRAKIA